MECSLAQLKSAILDTVKTICEKPKNREDYFADCIFYAIDYISCIYYVFVGLDHFYHDESEEYPIRIKINTIMISSTGSSTFTNKEKRYKNYKEEEFVNIISIPIRNLLKINKTFRILIDPYCARHLGFDSRVIYENCVEFIEKEKSKENNVDGDREYYARELATSPICPTENPFEVQSEEFKQYRLLCLRELSGLDEHGKNGITFWY